MLLRKMSFIYVIVCLSACNDVPETIHEDAVRDFKQIVHEESSGCLELVSAQAMAGEGDSENLIIGINYSIYANNFCSQLSGKLAGFGGIKRGDKVDGQAELIYQKKNDNSWEMTNYVIRN